MEYSIKKYRLERVLIDDFKINLPEVPEYHFQTGIRRSIAIIPRWTTWKMEYKNEPEEIYEFDIIMVYLGFDSKIETTHIRMSELNDVLSQENKTSWDIREWFISNRGKDTLRTEEQFKVDYQSALEKIQEKLTFKK